jgi:hypothetical protein
MNIESIKTKLTLTPDQAEHAKTLGLQALTGTAICAGVYFLWKGALFKAAACAVVGIGSAAHSSARELQQTIRVMRGVRRVIPEPTVG